MELFARSVPAKKGLFAGSVLANIELFAGIVPEKLFNLKIIPTCIAMEILSLSLRISWRFFVPKMFLREVWARSLMCKKCI